MSQVMPQSTSQVLSQGTSQVIRPFTSRAGSRAGSSRTARSRATGSRTGSSRTARSRTALPETAPKVAARAASVAAVLAAVLAAALPAGVAAASPPTGTTAGPLAGDPSGSADPVGFTGSVTAGTPGSPAGDHLTVTVRQAGEGRDGTYELSCHPAAGNHPRAASACDALDRKTVWGSDPFAPVPPDSVCTMLYGGPATAHVTGTWAGRPVDATYDRTDGCETGRWDGMVPLLPDLRAQGGRGRGVTGSAPV